MNCYWHCGLCLYIDYCNLKHSTWYWMCPLSQSSCCTLLTMMQWPPLKGTLVLHEGKSWQSECEKAIPEWAPFHPSNWLAMGHTSKAYIPEISVFYLSCHHVVGQWIRMSLSLWCKRGLLAYVYNGVSDWMNALVAGNGSYILQLIGLDLHGPTVT